jgi:transposase-like protein
MMKQELPRQDQFSRTLNGSLKPRPAVTISFTPPRPPDPEVVEKARRRTFSAEYKLRILREAEACTASGEIGALLRREGLYSSNLTSWRRQREQGEQGALSAKPRGRKAKAVDPLTARLAQLERENARLLKRLEQAETIIEVQKKVAALLGSLLPDQSGEER